MTSLDKAIDLTRFAAGSTPTPDALLIALLEQQRRLDEQLAESRRQSEIIEKKSSVITNQKARIEVLEELLRQAKQQRFGASSERNVLQADLVFDEAEALADGTPDADEGELGEEEDAEPASAPKRRRKPRKGFAADLPRVQERWLLSDEERARAIDTFFVKVREQLDITPAKVQVVEYLQEKAVVLDAEGERTLVVAERPDSAFPIGKCIASVNLLVWLIIAKYADGLPLCTASRRSWPATAGRSPARRWPTG